MRQIFIISYSVLIKDLTQIKKHVLVENESNELSKKVQAISTKELKKDSISR